MKTELIFFDIDDTLCRDGRLDAYSHDVLGRLHHETNVKLAIATGRSIAMIPADIQLLMDEGYIDAFISANGQYNMLGGDVLSHYPISQEEAATLVEICNRFGLAYQQLSENHIAWSQEMPNYEYLRYLFTGCLIDAHYYLNHKIYQFSVFLPENEEYPEIISEFDALGFHFARWHKGGADVLPKGGSKARGISDVCQKLGINVKNTMAFGDGLNDLEMLQHVGVGIAMGDAWPQLQAVADYVTGSIEEKGIHTALIHHGILKN